MHFRSKRDAWLVAVVWITVALMLTSVVGAVRSERWFLAAIVSAGAVLMLWVLYGTSYRIAEGTLHIRCALFRWSIPLNSITSVTPSDDAVSSPATSMDRLEIRYAGGKRRVLVSPLDKERFRASLWNDEAHAR